MTKTRAALIRALRTVAQAALAGIGVATRVDAVDWQIVASTSALTGIVSLLTSLVTDLPEVDQ